MAWIDGWGRWRCLLTSLLLVFTLPTRAQTKITFDLGWGDHTRAGAWTPIYVEITDPKARAAVLEYDAPYDSGTSIRIRQNITVGPTPGSKYLLLAPLVYSWSDPTVLRVRDAQTGRLMAEEPIEDQSNNFGDARDQLFQPFMGPYIGVSGRGPCLQQVATGNNGPMVGYLRPLLMPRAAEGYAALDIVVLNQPDLNALDVPQQKALLDWVRSGGHLLLWPSEDPVPPANLIVAALPCKIGDVVAVTVDKNDLHALGLPDRFSTFRARTLRPAEAAVKFPLLGKSGSGGGAVAYRGRVGIGHVTVVSFDASGLGFNNTSDAQRFWTPLLNPLSTPAANVDTGYLQRTGTVYNMNQAQDPSQAQASSQIMDLLGDVPGVGAFGFGYVAMVLLGVMALVGPVDWFILKKLGRQPWTWVTTSGWILMITAAAISIGSFVRSGDLHFRTLRVVDQADDQVYARQDVVGIYSSRTTDYKLDTPGDAWWRPLSADSYAYGRGLTRPLEFAQTDRGNVPLAMTINVWNLRFLKGQSYPHDPPALATTLNVAAKGEPRHVTGTITNLTDAKWSHVWLRTPIGITDITPTGGVAPKAKAHVDAVVQSNSDWTNQPGVASYGRYGPRAPMVRDFPLGLIRAASSLEIRTDTAIEQLIQQDVGRWHAGAAGANQPRLAVVYALSEDATSPLKLADQQPVEKHWEVVRAVVTIRPAAAPNP